VRLSEGLIDVDVWALQGEVEDEGRVELVGQVVAHLVGDEHAVDDDVELWVLGQQLFHFRGLKNILDCFQQMKKT